MDSCNKKTGLVKMPSVKRFQQNLSSSAGSAILGAPFYTSLFDPETGGFLSGGTIYFYGSDMETPKPVYSTPDTSGSPYPNPFTLNNIAVMPPMYFLTDEPYWIEIYPPVLAGGCPKSVDPDYSFMYYPNANIPGSNNSQVFNYLTNGQFLHIIPFNTPPVTVVPGYDPRQIVATTTEINQGWWLDVDAFATNIVKVSYNSAIIGQYPGNPVNFVNIQVTAIGASMNFLDLYQYIGAMNMLQGDPVTLSIFGSCTNGITAATLSVLVETNDQNGQLVLTPVGNIAVTNNLGTLVLNFNMPPINSGNPNQWTYNRIIVRWPLLTLTSIQVTNMFLEEGTVLQPQFIVEPTDQVSAKTFAQDLLFPSDSAVKTGEYQYFVLTYYNNQFQFLKENIGRIVTVPSNAVPEDVILLEPTRKILNTHAYYGQIPQSRLYSRIGNIFGGAALSAASAANVVTATSLLAGAPFTAWNARTSGLAITQTVMPNQLGVTAAQTASGNTVRITFSDNYAPNSTPTPPTVAGFVTWSGSIPDSGPIGSLSTRTQGLLTYNAAQYVVPRGNRSINVNTINAGGPSAQAIVDVTFSAQNISDYKTDVSVFSTAGNADGYIQYNSLEWGSLSVNSRGSYAYVRDTSPSLSAVSIQFSVDGNISAMVGGSQHTITVPFLSANTLQRNIKIFIDAINTPFQYRLICTTLPVLQPSDVGPGFTYSSTVQTDAIWHTINGVGTQPDFSAFGVVDYYLVPLTGSETTTEYAAKVATALRQNNSTFAIPEIADLPTLPAAELVYGIEI